VNSASSYLARLGSLLLLVALALAALGCEDAGKKSATLAKGHVLMLAKAAKEDVQQVRRGLPEGAAQLTEVYQAAFPELPSAETARKALRQTRERIPDLSIAKSTFFAMTAPDGRVLRSDMGTDDLAEKNIFTAFPELAQLSGKAYVETRGAMPEAAGVRGRPDAQWVAGVPVKVGADVRGAYVTGWSWSKYAYRLETALRSAVMGETVEGDKIPLLYVYVLVGGVAYGGPVAPLVNGKAIVDQHPLERITGDQVWASPLEIEGRTFGVAVVRLTELGPDVAIAVLRSET
jgi:hypothetical protein